MEAPLEHACVSSILKDEDAWTAGFARMAAREVLGTESSFLRILNGVMPFTQEGQESAISTRGRSATLTKFVWRKDEMQEDGLREAASGARLVLSARVDGRYLLAKQGNRGACAVSLNPTRMGDD